MKQVTDDIKIKGTVTGNDIEGNIYNEVVIDDGTGAFIICIARVASTDTCPWVRRFSST